MASKPLLIMDSSPLITLSLFPVHKPAIETVLSIADVWIVETVAVEITAFPTHRDALHIEGLLKTKRLIRQHVPITDQDTFIDAYQKVDSGERDTIRLALANLQARLVLDDTAAFVTACHFNLFPVMLLDLIAEWVKIGVLEKNIALTIVMATASRYSEAFVNHTKYKINEA
jgi:predicted nucleic acid-binding protein